jgi:hypothetical protein
MQASRLAGVSQVQILVVFAGFGRPACCAPCKMALLL